MNGHRVWILEADGHLMSLFYVTRWTPGLNVSTCKKWHEDRYVPSHAVPYDDCSCGFWLLPTYDEAYGYIMEKRVTTAGTLMAGVDAAMSPRSFPLSDIAVIGTVQSYGKHVEHEFGTRCERIEVTGLYRSPSLSPTVLRMTSQRYDVPLLDLPS